MMTGGQGATRTVRGLDRLSPAPSRTEGPRCAAHHSIGGARKSQSHIYLYTNHIHTKKPTLDSIGCLKMTPH
jgi:hypothetical protein